ncbi:hypothetical protein Pmar_PMAR028772 [Perkinsus marinus ATCC 50983]|uniref:Uncharacterized protein n=1 Tax=Perkinsus marinus (strain ATCC 50983 / TXsc) TaxID=423536 RepID=C5LFR8_PERM5|nr:hypothetical protein Pmar_PMAR028772 [Perkinsus marinus ATCC 50983]EER04423.1 hypothetical protein Pmar_PMAR028772 [Perkinsus marinus ATCC 50983]|eukprot:XP_002772607.1 hypothetical protein Pmar_PMAR028772 [Perkinsus marinus ATCC 50983]
MVARSPGEQVGKVCTLTLAVQDEKGDMNIWKVEKAEEKAVLDALGTIQRMMVTDHWSDLDHHPSKIEDMMII